MGKTLTAFDSNGDEEDNDIENDDTGDEAEIEEEQAKEEDMEEEEDYEEPEPVITKGKIVKKEAQKQKVTNVVSNARYIFLMTQHNLFFHFLSCYPGFPRRTPKEREQSEQINLRRSQVVKPRRSARMLTRERGRTRMMRRGKIQIRPIGES